MTSTTEVREVVEPYLARAVLGDAPSAVRLTLDLLDRGATADSVIVDLLGAAQRECGERWLRNEWTVADEHIVSGVTQRALDALANSLDVPARRGSVVVACAEGDWHSLPAQMGAEVLRVRGFSVTFLGASTPAEHVAGLLARARPDALIITCNVPLFFSGVSRLADAAHRSGVPVMTGGRALPSLERSLRLGADSWAPDIASAADRLELGFRGPGPGAAQTALSTAGLQLDLDSRSLASAAFDSLFDMSPFMRTLDKEQLARTNEDLAFIVRFVGAALLVDDPAVLGEFIQWLKSLLTARNVPPAALLAGLEVLIPLITDVDVAAGELTRNAAQQLSLS